MINKKNFMDYDKSKVEDIACRAVDKYGKPIATEAEKKRRKIIKTVVVVGASVLMVGFSIWYQVTEIKDIAWRLGCMDGGLSPQQCVDVKKVEKAK